MSSNSFYLEAPGRTQDLLNLKWTLRAAGCTIGSTWHEEVATSPALAFQDHWNLSRCMEELQICDSLVVVCEASNTTAQLTNSRHKSITSAAPN